VVLTASGGPFRGWTREELEHATPEQALRHPRWAMGKKVTIDSATLMNKALELVEARWLFGLSWDRLGAVVHPQSSAHAIVELADGSTITQSAPADMRVPIQRALTHPWSVEGLVAATGASGVHGLEFGAVDDGLFPSVLLARRVIEEGGSAGCVLNAANEVAVEAFLRGRIGFLRITEVVREVMDASPTSAIASIDDVMSCDAQARARAEALVRARAAR
jgi:1-deoxy-D-xylulose-5-phosphate reductoisomerase